MIAISMILLILAIFFYVMYFAIPSLDPEGSGPNAAKAIMGIIGFVLLLSSGLIFHFGR
jgi:hypothetical protein